MSRTFRRKALQNVPDISLHGTGLDRILNGVLTQEVVKQAVPLPTVRAMDIFVNALVARPLAPLVIVMHEVVCACGAKSEPVFGYYARREVKQISNGEPVVSYRFVDKPFDKPIGVHYNQREVPLCHNCIPNGLRYFA